MTITTYFKLSIFHNGLEQRLLLKALQVASRIGVDRKSFFGNNFQKHQETIPGGVSF